jgi:hypothetical protein
MRDRLALSLGRGCASSSIVFVDGEREGVESRTAPCPTISECA